ncbi:MAG: hypothetical protein PHG85_03965 [Candidatus Altiarchaeota archaeon]|nr:hypothetical protein [Candidatus Altiarchaeota archaeon]
MEKSEKIVLAVVAVALVIVLLFLAPFLGIVLWQLGVFNIGSTPVTSSGFAKIKPQLVSADFEEDGTFSALFTNGAGTTITLNQTGIVVSDASGLKCETVRIEPASVSAGDNFRLTSSGCTALSQEDTYNLAFSIPYHTTIGNITRERTENGKIRGLVE